MMGAPRPQQHIALLLLAFALLVQCLLPIQAAATEQQSRSLSRIQALAQLRSAQQLDLRQSQLLRALQDLEKLKHKLPIVYDSTTPARKLPVALVESTTHAKPANSAGLPDSMLSDLQAMMPQPPSATGPTQGNAADPNIDQQTQQLSQQETESDPASLSSGPDGNHQQQQQQQQQDPLQGSGGDSEDTEAEDCDSNDPSTSLRGNHKKKHKNAAKKKKKDATCASGTSPSNKPQKNKSPQKTASNTAHQNDLGLPSASGATSIAFASSDGSTAFAFAFSTSNAAPDDQALHHQQQQQQEGGASAGGAGSVSPVFDLDPYGQGASSTSSSNGITTEIRIEQGQYDQGGSNMQCEQQSGGSTSADSTANKQQQQQQCSQNQESSAGEQSGGSASDFDQVDFAGALSGSSKRSGSRGAVDARVVDDPSDYPSSIEADTPEDSSMPSELSRQRQLMPSYNVATEELDKMMHNVQDRASQLMDLYRTNEEENSDSHRSSLITRVIVRLTDSLFSVIHKVKSLEAMYQRLAHVSNQNDVGLRSEIDRFYDDLEPSKSFEHHHYHHLMEPQKVLTQGDLPRDVVRQSQLEKFERDLEALMEKKLASYKQDLDSRLQQFEKSEHEKLTALVHDTVKKDVAESHRTIMQDLAQYRTKIEAIIRSFQGKIKATMERFRKFVEKLDPLTQQNGAKELLAKVNAINRELLLLQDSVQRYHTIIDQVKRDYIKEAVMNEQQKVRINLLKKQITQMEKAMHGQEMAHNPQKLNEALGDDSDNLRSGLI